MEISCLLGRLYIHGAHWDHETQNDLIPPRLPTKLCVIFADLVHFPPISCHLEEKETRADQLLIFFSSGRKAAAPPQSVKLSVDSI